MTCLDENFLLAVIKGNASQVQHATLLQHISVCEECRRFVVAVLESERQGMVDSNDPDKAHD
jgi:hypothetical protein